MKSKYGYKFADKTDRELIEFCKNLPNDIEANQKVQLIEELAERLEDSLAGAVYWASEYKRLKQVVDRF